MLLRLYLFCRPKASVSVDCRADSSASRGAAFFPSWENSTGWLCLRWACKYVVLPFFVATNFEQSRQTGLSVLMVSPRSLGLKPCSSRGSLAAVCVCVCVLAAPPPPTDTKILNDWQDGSLPSFHSTKPQTRPGAETDARYTDISRPEKLLSSFSFIVRLIDLLIIAKGQHRHLEPQ